MVGQASEIRPGTVLIREGTALPGGVRIQMQPLVAGWQIVKDSSTDIDRAITKAGWHFFYLAEELEQAALGRSVEMAIIKALQKLARDVERENKNAFEITDIRTRHLLGLHRARVKAHARHIKASPIGLRELDTTDIVREAI